MRSEIFLSLIEFIGNFLLMVKFLFKFNFKSEFNKSMRFWFPKFWKLVDDSKRTVEWAFSGNSFEFYSFLRIKNSRTWTLWFLFHVLPTSFIYLFSYSFLFSSYLILLFECLQWWKKFIFLKNIFFSRFKYSWEFRLSLSLT